MNQPHHKIRQRFSQTLAALVTIGILSLHQAKAANVFWDSNGPTPGAGDPATGTWGTTNIWNTDTTGGAGTFSSTVGAANDAFFSAGSDGSRQAPSPSRPPARAFPAPPPSTSSRPRLRRASASRSRASFPPPTSSITTSRRSSSTSTTSSRPSGARCIPSGAGWSTVTPGMTG